MGIAVEKCPACGTPYMSALKPGEAPGDRFCYNCNSKASDALRNSTNAAPIGSTPSSATLSSVGEDLMLQPTDDQQAALITTHKQANARDQIVGQIHSNRGAQGNPLLPSDAPEYEAPPRPPLFTVASGIRLAILLVILGVTAKVVYSVYQNEFGKPVSVSAPETTATTVAEVTKPAAPAQPITPPAPVPATPKPAEKPAPAKPATPSPRPRELDNDGGTGSLPDEKSAPTTSGPGKSAPVSVTDLISTNSRQKARSADDDDPIAVAKKTPQPTPPPPGPGVRANGTKTPDDQPPVDPAVAMLEKNSKKDPTKPPAPPLPPGVGPNQPAVSRGGQPPVGPPGGPGGPPMGPIPGNIPGGQQPPVQRPAQPQAPAQPQGNLAQNGGVKMPEGPITVATPAVFNLRNDMVSGVTFLQAYTGWFCKDYDDAHSLRESNIRGRENVIMLTPAQRNPAKLCALIEIPKQSAGKKPELIIEVTTKDTAHSWWLHGNVEGADVQKMMEVKSTDAKPWTEVHIDLSTFVDRRIVLQLEVMPPQGKAAPDYAGYIRGMRLNWAK